MDILKDYLFHYNSDTELWAAFRIGDHDAYMANMKPHVGCKAVYHQEFDVLVSILLRILKKTN